MLEGSPNTIIKWAVFVVNIQVSSQSLHMFFRIPSLLFLPLPSSSPPFFSSPFFLFWSLFSSVFEITLSAASALLAYYFMKPSCHIYWQNANHTSLSSWNQKGDVHFHLRVWNQASRDARVNCVCEVEGSCMGLLSKQWKGDSSAFLL